MNKETVLDLVEELHSQYEESPVLGGEVDNEVTDQLHQASFDLLNFNYPLQDDWVSADKVLGVASNQMSEYASSVHQTERSYLIDRLEQADNVPTVTIDEITHNNLIEGAKEVYRPTNFYIPQTGDFAEGHREIQSFVDAFEELESTWISTSEDDFSSCYLICGDYIRMKQCTQLPRGQADWLPGGRFREVNKEISEHRLYSSLGTEPGTGDYILSIASTISSEPYIRDNGAAKITVE